MTESRNHAKRIKENQSENINKNDAEPERFGDFVRDEVRLAFLG